MIAIAVIVGLLATMRLSMVPPAGGGQPEAKEQEQVYPGPE